jgi:putative ATP-dependent endonuclease of OLD family
LCFKRFLEIAEKINKEVVVVTDSDGDIDAVNKKYENYLGDNEKPNIKICFSHSKNLLCNYFLIPIMSAA